MTEFDSFFLGSVILTFIVLIVTIIVEQKKKIAFVLVIADLCILAAIGLAFYYNWESSILKISTQNNTSHSENYVQPSEPNIETVPRQDSIPQTTYETEPGFLLGTAYESHTPDDRITASVDFREWESEMDQDLRNNTYADESGTSFYSYFSNMFNAIGGGGSESDKINSEIHIPVSTSLDVDFTDLYFVGSIIAEKRTQGSGAYADIAILIDGVEKWRSDDSITGNTVRPIEFAVNLADVKSEIVIRTSCIPLDNGLALGFVGIDVTHGSNSDIQESLQNNAEEEDIVLFVSAFENHFPHNNGVDFVEFRNWDTFSDADLRTEQYIDTGGIFIKFSNTFSSLGSTIENQIESDIHLVINPRKELSGGIWTGLIVAEQSTQGSSAYANIVIYVDGSEKWRTSEPLTGNTVAPIEFTVDLSEAQYEVIIKTTCIPNDNGLAIGFVNMDFRYSQQSN